MAPTTTTSSSSSDPANTNIIYSVTVSAPTNIAVVKYWGKTNVEYNTPLNDSLSLTLDGLRAVTTVAASRSFTKDRLWLNGVEVDGASESKRFRACVDGIKRMKQKTDSASKDNVPSKDMYVHVSSYNNFPTAAGLASSAAGYAALVYGLAQLFNVEEEFPYQLSTIARQGSGSACRSLYGGLVAWRKGGNDKQQWLDSKAEPIVDEQHWPEMRAIIAVVSDKQKDIGSTTGMATSAETSDLLKYRAASVVPQRMIDTIAAYKSKDFNQFAMLTMKDSNQFHATCLDTYPPIFYLNDISKSIIRLLSVYNDWACDKDGNLRVAYTFDAGPNAVLYVLQPHVQEVTALLKYYYYGGSDDGSDGNWIHNLVDASPSSDDSNNYKVDPSLLEACDKIDRKPAGGDVQKLYLTKVGPGAQILSNGFSNLDPQTGINMFHPPQPASK